MQGFFDARHVAVFGVSTKSNNLGQRILNNLLAYGYGGRISLIGRGGGALAGHPIRESLAECDGEIDLAVVLTPAPTIPAIFAQCAARGIKRIVVESGGFNELGGEGDRLTAELTRIAREYDLRFVGPNGIGVVDNHRGLAVPFPIFPRPAQGPTSIITQSGGVGLLYANYLLQEGLGMAKFVSVGNKVNVDENDLLPYFERDEHTGIILAYLESVPDGRRLFEAIRAARKPVIVHKSNVSDASATIAGSHTAALMNNDAVVSAALRQAGAVRTDRVDETVAAVKAFLLPPMPGNRVMVVSRSGGHAIIAADSCAKVGFEFAELPASFYDSVRQKTRADVIRLGNPLDLGDLFDIEAYLAIMAECMAQPNVDGVIFLFIYLSAYKQDVLMRLIDHAEKLTRDHQRPLALVIHTWPEEMARIKRLTRFPLFDTAEEAVAALAAGRDRAAFRRHAPRRTPRVHRPDAAATLIAGALGQAYLRQDQAFALLDAYGIAHPPVCLATTAAEAARAAKGWGGGPVALKVESPQAMHKTDVGGVLLDRQGPAAIRAAFAQLQQNLLARHKRARFDGALVMPMAPKGVELIAGAKRDPSFGPVVLLGWGGVAAEAMEKVSLRLAPLTKWEAEQMIAELPGQKLFAGFRGRPAVDRRALADLLLRLGQLAHLPGVAEIDLNPVRVYAKGALALDARVKLE